MSVRRIINALALPLHLLSGLRIEVAGVSMEPTYPEGSRLWVSRLVLRLSQPRRGDLVVIRLATAPPRLELKRVVGLPYEHVRWTANGLLVNGTPIHEPYARIAPAPGDDDAQEWRLGPGEYFVMGDNRLHSQDSRHYGPIRGAQIVGKILPNAQPRRPST